MSTTAPTLTQPVNPVGLEPVQMEKMFGGLDKMNEALPPDKRQHMEQLLATSSDPNGDKALFANVAYLSDAFGIPVEQVAANSDAYRESYAKQMEWDDAGSDDQKFYSRVGQYYQQRRDEQNLVAEAQSKLFGAFAKGEVDPRATVQQTLEEMKTKPGYDPKRLDLYRAVASQQWEAWQKTGEAYPDAVAALSDYFKIARNGDGRQYAQQLQARKAAIAAIQAIPTEDLDSVLGIAARGLPEGNDQNFAAKVSNRFARGVADLAIKGGQGLKDIAISASAPGGAANVIVDQFERTATRKLDNAVNGVIDPNTSKQWLANGILNAAQGLPAMAATFTPPGIALNLGAFTEQARGHFEDAGVPAGKANILAPIAGLALTALNTVNSQVVLGKAATAGVENWMAQNIAGKVGSELVKGYAKNILATGAIDTAAMVPITAGQMLTEPAIQAVGAQLDQAIPQVKWTGWNGELTKLKNATPETLASLVPLIALGTGAGVLRNRAYAATTIKNQAALEAIGLPADVVKSIMDARTVEESTKLLQDNMGNREANPRAIEALNQQMQAPKAEPQIHELENGGFVVTDATGKLIDYADTPAAAQKLADGAKEIPVPENAGLKVSLADDGTYLVKNDAGAVIDQAGSAEMAAKAIQDHTRLQAEQVKAKANSVAKDEAKSELTGISNAEIDTQLEQMGFPKATHAEKITFKEAVDDAAAKVKEDPQAGSRLVNELKENPRPVTGKEDALLLYEQNRLRLERDAAEKAVIKAAQSGDEQALADALARQTKARFDYADAADVVTRVGTENAQGLALRRMMLKEDYSLAAVERRAIAAQEGKPLDEAQSAEIRELQSRLEENQRILDEYASKRNQPERTAPPKKPSRISKALSEQADAARQRILDRMKSGRVLSGVDPTDLYDYVIIGADHIAKGLTKFADWSEAMLKEFGENIRPHLQDIFDQATNAKSESQRTEAKKARLEKGIETAKERLANEDFSDRPKREPVHLDEEGNRLQAEYDMAKLELDRAIERYRFENSSGFNRAKEHALDFYDSARTLMTTGEFSFLLRQGKMAALSHPLLTARALPDMMRSFLSNPTEAHAINLKILNHPDIAAAKAAKLHILEPGASLNKKEELFASRLVEKIPVVHRFEQAATTFMNKLRFDLWNQMRQSSGGLSPAEQKQLAMFVNESTGRGGLGAFEKSSVILGRLMFSPRFAASRMQLAIGHSLWGGTMATRRIIATEYAKTLIGLGLYYSALSMFLGDDDKKKPVIGTDPRSSDFGKVRIGNSRIDPLAGVQQMVVFGARSITGQKTNSKGQVSDIRGDKIKFGGEKWSDVAANFARSKLHPLPGAVVNLFDGTDLAGNKVTPLSQAENMLAPVTYMDVYQALQEQDLPDGVAMGLLAMLGEGLQTYNPDQRKIAPTEKK